MRSVAGDNSSPASKILEQVLDGDRLCGHANPLGGDHDRQALDERADQFKRKTPGANHNGCAKFEDRHARVAQDLSDLVSAAQVRRQRVLVAAQSPQIDDSEDAGDLCGSSEISCRLAVRHLERPRRTHRVHEVVRHGDAVEGGVQSRWVKEVSCDNLGRSHRLLLDHLRTSRQAADTVPARLEQRQQPSADVPCRARQENERCRHRLIHDADASSRIVPH